MNTGPPVLQGCVGVTLFNTGEWTLRGVPRQQTAESQDNGLHPCADPQAHVLPWVPLASPFQRVLEP